MDAIDAKPLPTRPSLEQFKKQAKDLLKAARAGDHEALRRINDQSPDFDPATATRTASSSVLADAQFAIAREYGFKSWPRFSQHLRDLAHGEVGQYEAAVDAIVTGDLAALESLLDAQPGLVRRRSTRTHAATLLHYVAANGVENYRQKTPPNAVEVADLLLSRGSEPDALAFMYDGDCTTMGLLVSSAHPAERGVQVALVDKLVDFGAAPDGPKCDGDPVLTALIFGYPASADALVRRGARVDTIVAAAGMGDVEFVRSCFDADGVLRPDVPVVRSRARWMPVGARANVEGAFVLATWMGRTEIVDFLSQHVDLAAPGPHGFPALHWAVLTGNLAMVELLLGRGAPLEARDRGHNTTALGSAVWVTANGSREEYARVVPVIEHLLHAGARADAVTYPTGDETVDDLLRQHGARTP
jgi:hypothetical protein